MKIKARKIGALLAAANRRNQGGAFNPSTYLSNVLLWQEARLETGYSDGDAVGTITNQQGSASNATATLTSRPTFKTGIIGGRSVYRFNGSSNQIAGTISVTTTTLIAFLVGTLNSGTASYGRIISCPATTVDYLAADSADVLSRDGTSQGLVSYRNTTSLSAGGITYGTPFIAASRFDGTNHTLFIGSTKETPVASSGSFGVTQYSYGNQIAAAADSAWLNGDIGGIIIATDNASDATVTNLMTAWGAIYGL